MGVEFAAVTLEGRRYSLPSPLQHDETELQVEDWSIVPEAWLTVAMGRMTPEERSLMLRHKLIPYCWLPHCTVYCIVDEASLHEGRSRGLTLVGRISPQLYRKLVRRNFSKALEHRAVHALAKTKPWASAHHRLSDSQLLLAGLIVICCLAVTVIHSAAIILSVFQVLAGLFFLMVVSLRCLCLMPLPKKLGHLVPLLQDAELPVYTVLVPLFREVNVCRQIVAALSLLDYPQDKLDIKIILEENDRPMHVAVREMNLPWYFDILIVPRGKPQTKPRALNYAMQFARGTLVTIYDGEDIPQPGQLKLAAAQFNHAEDDVACFQAALDFFNPTENWLARHFTTEYAALFQVVLPTLAAYGLPLPLGGTSNHFRGIR